MQTADDGGGVGELGFTVLKLTNEMAWRLLGNLDTESPWCHTLLLKAVDGDVGTRVEVFIRSTQVFVIWIFICRALEAFDPTTC